MKLVLRGHHLLCLQGFQGYGYDEAFVENMSEINRLRKLEDTAISLTDTADDICKACPNLKGGLCENQKQDETIKSMDEKVLSKLDHTKEHNALNLFKEVEKIFNSKESVSKICSKCMWHKECLFYENL